VAFVFRSVAALAAIAATLLAAFIARRKTFAAAFVGWNPLLAISSAGGGHNDVLMLVLMLGALTLASRRRDSLRAYSADDPVAPALVSDLARRARRGGEDAVAQVLALGLAAYLLPDRVPF
jgi:hypothetical protein